MWDSRVSDFKILRVLTHRIRILNSRPAEQFFLQDRHRLYVELLRLSKASYADGSRRVILPIPSNEEFGGRIGSKVKTVEKELHGGVVGLVLDGRGRPIALDPADPDRVGKIQQWAGALNAYPEPEAQPVG